MKTQEELITKIFEERFKCKISSDGKVVNCDLFLRDYEHYLPNSITNINGYLDLRGYNHPLPNSITNITGSLSLTGYNYSLPNSIKNVNGSIWVDNDYTGLPDNIHEWGEVNLIRYFI